MDNETYTEQGVWTALGTRHENEDGEVTWTLERREGYIGSSAEFVCNFKATATREDAEELLLWQIYGGDTLPEVTEEDIKDFERWLVTFDTPQIKWNV